MKVIDLEKTSQSKWIKNRKWYNGYKFPLIPILSTRKTDQHNESGFTFHWLFFKLWSLGHIELELSIVCSSHWGIGAIGILPYLRWCVCVPLPEKLMIKVDNALRRKPLTQKPSSVGTKYKT